MLSHLFVFGFITLLVVTMEMTWPVKGKSYVEDKPCATHLVSENHVTSNSIFKEDENAKSN